MQQIQGVVTTRQASLADLQFTLSPAPESGIGGGATERLSVGRDHCKVFPRTDFPERSDRHGTQSRVYRLRRGKLGDT
jgi:hypothetical protein